MGVGGEEESTGQTKNISQLPHFYSDYQHAQATILPRFCDAAFISFSTCMWERLKRYLVVPNLKQWFYPFSNVFFKKADALLSALLLAVPSIDLEMADTDRLLQTVAGSLLALGFLALLSTSTFSPELARQQICGLVEFHGQAVEPPLSKFRFWENQHSTFYCADPLAIVLTVALADF